MNQPGSDPPDRVCLDDLAFVMRLVSVAFEDFARVTGTSVAALETLWKELAGIRCARCGGPWLGTSHRLWTWGRLEWLYCSEWLWIWPTWRAKT